MKLRTSNNRSGVTSLRLLAGMAGVAAIPLLAFAAAPSWWGERGVVDPSATANDFAPANQGQLKNIAKAAAAELDARLPGGAGETIQTLVANWASPSAQTNDFAPVNLGQLKNVAKPFYGRLIAVRYVDNYPWSGGANAPSDFAAANIGQVKNLFSFDLQATDAAHDADQNGLPDWWEKFYFGNISVDPNAPAPRGDGATNLQAFQQGLNPLDYYNGQRPVLTVVSGNNQQSAPGSFLPLPLVIKVTGAANQPLANAPVTFTVTVGGGGLAADAASATAATLELRTGSDGIASAFYQQPNAPAVTSEVTTSAGAPPNTVQVSFTATTTDDGSLTASPPSLQMQLSHRQTATTHLILSNPTEQNVSYSVAVQNNEMPEYSFVDSKTGGVPFAWDEIRTTGTRLAVVSKGDDVSERVSFNSFRFPFYGQTYSQVFVSSNGYLNFGTQYDTWANSPLPSTLAPALLVAPLWADLYPPSGGNVYYKEEPGRLIVQFQQIYWATFRYTFQVVLFADGTIEFRYLTLTGDPTHPTVGIQDGSATKAVQVAFREPYLENNLAVRIKQNLPFLEVAPISGTVAANSSAQLDVLFRSLTLPPGTYSATIQITGDRPGAEPVSIPAVLEKLNLPPAVAIVSPSQSSTQPEGRDLALTVNARDPDGQIARVEFYAGATKVAEYLVSPGELPFGEFTANWSALPLGTFSIIARAFDQYAGWADSAPITITVLPDPDDDNDGLTNSQESDFGTDPANPDTDGDGLLDGAEALQFGTDPRYYDTDYDGLSDGDEVNTYQTDPTKWDTDGDDLSDGDEVRTYNTSPTNRDTDGDQLPDRYEVNTAGFNPLDSADGNADSDQDGLSFGYEFLAGTNPTLPDTDGDGILDPEEDADRDGLTNLQEATTHRTHPGYFDTDVDLLPDGWEVRFGLDPRDATGNNGQQGDPDGDGVLNLQENSNNADPRKADTDGDGANDRIEIGQASDPNSAADGGQAPPPGTTAALQIRVGDHSGSESERYVLELAGIEGDTRKIICQSAEFGVVDTCAITARKGAKYTIALKHLATDPEYGGYPRADYDYTAEVTADPNVTPAPYVKVDDPTGMLGVHEEGSFFFAEGKTATLYVPRVEFLTPKDSPVTAPNDSGTGQNEFTFSAAAVGELTMNLRAKVLPSGAADKIQGDCTFEAGAIPGSAQAWVAGNPGGKATANGDDLTASVTFSGLPPSNASFGRKTARVVILGSEQARNEYEVFFLRDEKNHPGTESGSTPNWFYYWLQTVQLLGPNPKVLYKTSGNNAYDPNSNEIRIVDSIVQPYTPPYGANGTLEGIDHFGWTTIHESQHYADWASFWDVDNSGVTKHQAAIGKTGPDDDKDDDRIPNRIEDANLNQIYDTGDLYDWQVYNTPTSGRPPVIINDFEDWASQRHKGAKGDQSKDWADPGSQH